VQAKGPKEGNNCGQKKAISRRDGSNGGGGHVPLEKSNGSPATIPTMSSISASLEWKKRGTAFYRNILREYGRINQPKLIRDAAVKGKCCRSWSRLHAGLIDW
jgi:hypothetical protein